MKKAINAWAYPGDMKLKDIFAAAKDAGFEGVETNLVETGEFSLESSEKDFEKIRKTADDAGVVLPSICSGLLWKYPLSDPDPAKANKGKDVVRKMIDAAPVLGADTVLVVPGVVTETNPYDEVYRRSLDAVVELSNYVGDSGVYIGIEDVWNKFLLTPMEMARFIDEAGSPWVQAYFDVGNVLVFAYPQHWIKILGSRIKKVHIKDFKTGPGEFVYLLEGDVNWPEVIKAFKSIGYDDFLVAEMGPYKNYPLQAARDISTAMDVILGREG